MDTFAIVRRPHLDTRSQMLAAIIKTAGTRTAVRIDTRGKGPEYWQGYFHRGCRKAGYQLRSTTNGSGGKVVYLWVEPLAQEEATA